MTATAIGVVPFSVDVPGETLQMDPDGAPLHANETGPVAPFQPETFRLNTARRPASTVAEVVPPVAAAIVRSPALTVMLMVPAALSTPLPSVTLNVKLSVPL